MEDFDYCYSWWEDPIEREKMYDKIKKEIANRRQQDCIIDEREPIFDFKNQETLDKYLKEWQERLMLTNWIINANIVEQNEITGLAGRCNADYHNSSAMIRIAEYNHDNDYIIKQPQELVLVHELLHCVFMQISNDDILESVFYEEKQHQTLERIAKSLIMAKYNLTYDWFKA